MYVPKLTDLRSNCQDYMYQVYFGLAASITTVIVFVKKKCLVAILLFIQFEKEIPQMKMDTIENESITLDEKMNGPNNPLKSV